MTNWRRGVAVCVLLVGWFTIGWFARGLIRPVPEGTAPALVQQAGQLITEQAYSAPTSRELAYAAIRGMIGALNDKYAVFWEQGTAERSGLAMAGNDAALGIGGQMEDGRFTVIALADDGPAAAAGLKRGDILVEVDGWQVKPGSSFGEVVAMLRGPENTTAHMKLLRGDELLEFSIGRAASVDVRMSSLGDIAYIRIDRFTETTPSEAKAALDALLEGGPIGLILDLRYNSGGLVEPTQQVLDLFLGEGVAFHGRTRDGSMLTYPTQSGGPAEDIPMVVLIGSDTYSAGETAAASLLDRNRATLIGQPTHGKGMFNATIPLADGSAVQFTVAQSLSPIRQTCYEGKGVPPDILVELASPVGDDTVIHKAVEYLQATPVHNRR